MTLSFRNYFAFIVLTLAFVLLGIRGLAPTFAADNGVLYAQNETPAPASASAGPAQSSAQPPATQRGANAPAASTANPSAAVSSAATAAAQPGVPLSQRADKAIKDWDRALTSIETTLDKLGPSITDEEMESFRAQLRQTRDDARRLAEEIRPRVAEAERLLATLTADTGDGSGPAVPDDDPQHVQYTKDVTTWRSRATSADAVATKAEVLLSRISGIRRTTLVTNLFGRTPLPWLPSSIQEGYSETVRAGTELAEAPSEWLDTLSDDQERTRNRAIIVGIWIMVGLVLGIALRWWLLKRFGRKDSIACPTYAQRTMAALGEGIANGLLPALILGSLIFWSHIAFADHALLQDTADAILIGLLLIALARAFTRAILAPDEPVWRIGPHDDKQASTLSWLIQTLAIVIALEVIFFKLNATLNFAEAAQWICISVFKLLEGLLLIRLSGRDLWNYETVTGKEEPSSSIAQKTSSASASPQWGEDVPGKGGEFLLALLRGVVILAAVVGSLAGLFGYGRMGEFLINGLLATCAVGGLGLIIRTLLFELIDLATNAAWLRSQFNWGDKAWEQIRFWVRALINLFILGLVVFFVAPAWGVPSEDVADTFLTLLTGFKIGNVTISLISIAIGFGIFIVLMAITRMIQSTLARKVLVQTNMDTGARNSLLTGLGYIGIIISAAVGIAAMGIDLSNIAIIAGALSVGIGFGMQNIVNNFVSGLILLVERPIKVGDWVIISGNEGIVKRISFRATELETSAKAAIIIPNSTLISSPFTNLTHRNRLGRVQVDVVVSKDNDPDMVRNILLDAARDQDLVLTIPAPSVSLTELGGGGAMSFSVYAHTSNISNGGSIRSAMRLEIDRRFKEEGIAFA